MQKLDEKITLWIHKKGLKQLKFWEFLSLFGLWGFVVYFLGVWAHLEFTAHYLLEVALPTLAAFLVSTARAALDRILCQRGTSPT